MRGVDHPRQAARPPLLGRAPLGAAGKITEDQLRRLAVVYVRQSSQMSGGRAVDQSLAICPAGNDALNRRAPRINPVP